MNRLELVLGTKTRSRPAVGHLGGGLLAGGRRTAIPQRIWDKRTGVIDKKVAEYWRENYDLVHILRRDWDKGLGKKLEGKIHLYVGDMDNYYLNNAVYLVEDFLKTHEEPGLRRRGRLRRPRRALLERRPDARRTRTRACATTRCSCPRSWSGSRRPRPPAPTSRAGGTEVAPDRGGYAMPSSPVFKRNIDLIDGPIDLGVEVAVTRDPKVLRAIAEDKPFPG